MYVTTSLEATNILMLLIVAGLHSSVDIILGEIAEMLDIYANQDDPVLETNERIGRFLQKTGLTE
jgi:hypothetical protein